MAVLAGLLCLRRRRCPDPAATAEPAISDDEMVTYCQLSAESQNWGDVP